MPLSCAASSFSSSSSSRYVTTMINRVFFKHIVWFTTSHGKLGLEEDKEGVKGGCSFEFIKKEYGLKDSNLLIMEEWYG